MTPPIQYDIPASYRDDVERIYKAQKSCEAMFLASIARYESACAHGDGRTAEKEVSSHIRHKRRMQNLAIELADKINTILAEYMIFDFTEWNLDVVSMKITKLQQSKFIHCPHCLTQIEVIG